MIVAPIGPDPLVIAHRGCSALRPEHTLAAYRLAIAQGADFIEPDVVSTKDGVLIARHENEISETTDIADHPEFADRRSTKTIDGRSVNGWFTEDFTLAEIKTLRAKERLGNLRRESLSFDGQESVPTIAEVFALAKAAGVGVIPETKHSTYFSSIKLPLEDGLLKLLNDAGFGDGRKAFIQSFEVGNLRELRRKTKIPLVQLMEAQGGPIDGGTYAEMASPEGLKAVRTYAAGIGVEKLMVWGTSLVTQSHEAGLLIFAWTFRPEARFVISQFRDDAKGELRWFLGRGVDGVFADLPEQAVAARRSIVR